VFLDADDWWDLNFLLNMKNLIDNFGDADIFASNYYWVKNDKKRKGQFNLEENYTGYLDYIRAYLFAYYMPLTSISTVIRKTVFLKLNGFKEHLKFGEDFDLWIRIALNYKIAFTNKALAYYNQDVDSNNRALGTKLWKPENHFIFNLAYLEVEEKTNPILKKLLDGLRVRALIRYRLAALYQKETNSILQSVDFSLQPKYYQRIYRWPIAIIRLYFRYKKLGSALKQKLIKFQK
jgi:hypothetical protein